MHEQVDYFIFRTKMLVFRIQHAERLGSLQNGIVRHEARDPLPLWVTSIVTHDVKLRWVGVVEDDPLASSKPTARDARTASDRHVGATEDEGACCDWKPRVDGPLVYGGK